MLKRSTIKILLGGTLCLSLLAPLALSASAEQDGRGRRGMRGMRGMRGGGPAAMLRELDLTEQQRDQLRSLREQSTASGDTARLVGEKRRALEEAIDSGADEGTLRQLAYDYGMAQGDAAVERARVQQQVLEILTPEQRAQLDELKAERKQEMEERRERFEKRRQERRENRRN